MKHKIALEEHFSIEGMEKYTSDVMNAPVFAEVMRRLVDTESLRIEEMDKAGIELSILSFYSPGIQAETDPDVAVQASKQANDFLCEKVIARHPDRYAGFAVVPLQKPRSRRERARALC